ncbi:MAG: hypothetical protein Q7U04_15710, partial [Bacteriovorax sp.]|nr:hypothetical protein [Bacteriovorax sp.]
MFGTILEKMMKPTLLLLLTLPIFTQAFSAEVKKAVAPKEVYGGIVIKEDSTLKKLITLPEVAGQYKACQAAFPQDLDKVPDCLWNGNGGSISRLTDSQKAAVTKAFAQEESARDLKENTGNPEKITNLTDRTLNVETDYKNDPGVKALTSFFTKKLNEALNSTPQDIKDKKIITVDHEKFIDLYSNELGKSVVNAFTAYCMESDSSCRINNAALCLISESPDTREKTIKANLKEINA